MPCFHALHCLCYSLILLFLLQPKATTSTDVEHPVHASMDDNDGFFADAADNLDIGIDNDEPDSPIPPKAKSVARPKKRRVHELMESDDSLSVSSFKTQKAKKVEESDEGLAVMAESVTSMARAFQMPRPVAKFDEESPHVLWAKLAAQKLHMLPDKVAERLKYKLDGQILDALDDVSP